MPTPTWDLWTAIGVFAIATLGIVLLGTRLATVVDRLADRTGLGEALAGAVILGGSTSLAGVLVSATAAIDGDARLAVSNSIGGIAVQTAFLVVADLAYRRANIEHAAASLGNIFSCVLMVVLLGIVLVGVSAPELELLSIHPVTPLLFATYLYGLHIGRRVGEGKMWTPAMTATTVVDEVDRDAHDESTPRLWLWFAGLVAGLTVVGWAIGVSGLTIVAQTGLSATIVGVLLTSVSTSLPELITAVAAARAGAPTLAVAGVVGGNTFDVLFVAVADILYREGSLYGAMGSSDVFVIAWALILTGLAGAGLLRRQPKGIGFEGVAILAAYVAGVVLLMTAF